MSERKHVLFTEQFPVSAYAGSSKNLKDLKARYPCSFERGNARGGGTYRLLGVNRLAGCYAIS